MTEDLQKESQRNHQRSLAINNPINNHSAWTAWDSPSLLGCQMIRDIASEVAAESNIRLDHSAVSELEATLVDLVGALEELEVWC